jgi:hypothetical protein
MDLIISDLSMTALGRNSRHMQERMGKDTCERSCGLWYRDSAHLRQLQGENLGNQY